jgi:glutamyl-Q tRNA(Asp) synthetase
LFTALASFLYARSRKGLWLLRIDDLDTTRNRPGAVNAILRALGAFGLAWDDSVYYQSEHVDSYEQYLAELVQNQLTYRCTCSRKMLDGLISEDDPDVKSNVYPGICRDKAITADTPHAIRVKTKPSTFSFHDGLQGLISHNLAVQHGDFILKRKDQIFAYQFAVVIDDALQKVNHVVRGCDLLEETPKQIFIQQTLGLPTPTYTHVPIIVDQCGYKLSKQTLAKAVDSQSPNKTLFDLLTLLKQNPPKELYRASVNELLGWAIAHWRPSELSLTRAIKKS